jgi:hypothetical protein
MQSVTLGDEEAKKRKVQKTILERKGPPTFSCAVEMISKTECRVHAFTYNLTGSVPMSTACYMLSCTVQWIT